ncbi:MAG TPA: hypothetical protein VEW03_04950 [Longimicrobiaceae bacterium]|nr:hypothetical protein [Longimicrobiaceae bacterium]
MFVSSFRPLTFGEILDGAFTLYRRHFLTLFVTALIPFVPMGIVSGWFSASTPTADATVDPTSFLGLFALMMLVSFVGFVLVIGALTRQFSQAYVGAEVSLGDGLRHGLRAFFYMAVAGLIATILAGVVWTVMAMLVGIVMAVMIPAAAAGGGGGGVLLTIVIVLVVVVFLVLMLATAALFFAVAPAIVVEKQNPFEAIGRSFSLAWGALPRVVGVLAVSYFIIILPIMGGVVVLLLTQGAETVATASYSPGVLAMQNLVTTVTYALTLPFMAAAMVLLYYDRRARTEAHDLEGMVQGLAAG